MNYKEVIVCGAPRTGTSIVAGILYLLGVDMGTNLKDNKFEDLDILFHVNEKIIRTIKLNVKTKKLWGFKDPWVGKYLHRINKLFKNPYYIYIKRDLNDTVDSDMRRNPKIKKRKFTEIRTLSLWDEIENILKDEKNVLELDFEYAFSNPREFMEKIITFTKIDVGDKTRKKILDFISKKGYKNLK